MALNTAPAYVSWDLEGEPPGDVGLGYLTITTTAVFPSPRTQ